MVENGRGLRRPGLIPARGGALRVEVENTDPLAGCFSDDGKAQSETGFSDAAFLGDEADDPHTQSSRLCAVVPP
jgi:hypothetical protein